jgi:IS5 family transposase
MARDPIPQKSFADLEMEAQGLDLETTLQGISDLLDRHAELVDMVHQDLVRGLRQADLGRRGMSAEQVLRAFVLKSVKNWDFRELRERTADGYSLRRFTHFFGQRVPRHDAFNRAFHRLTSHTLRAINESLVRAAVALGLEDGKRLRADTTVVETNIHYPTDSTLLWDCVRVITRLLKQLRRKLPSAEVRFKNRRRAARRRMQEIQRLSRTQRPRQTAKYRELIRITDRLVHSAREAIEVARKACPQDLVEAVLAESLTQQLQYYCGLADRVIDQSRRRVLEGQQVPNEEKIFSIFEPHTDLIMRGKAQKPVEFGHKVLLAESGLGLITDYRVLDGNPNDDIHVEPSLEHHRGIFGASPDLYAADRGFHSRAAVQACRRAGVSVECLPQRGGRKTPEREAYEHSPVFRRGQRFRAGIEGRISVLFRGRGMKRCLLEGPVRFEVFVGASVLANNLIVIAEELAKRSLRRRRAA